LLAVFSSQVSFLGRGEAEIKTKYSCHVIVALGIGSSMGLAARALAANPAFPTYPEGLSLAEIGA
jgi:hypothetical protein